jgi:hypothetical protein
MVILRKKQETIEKHRKMTLLAGKKTNLDRDSAKSQFGT